MITRAPFAGLILIRGMAPVLACMFAPASFAQPAALPAGMAIDEPYRAQFASCDARDLFGSVQLPILRADGSTAWFGCRRDPNRFTRFERLPQGGAGAGAIVITAKLGHDEDGSDKACHHAGGPTDQCATALMLPATERHPCLVAGQPASRCVPVDPNAVPYVVIPGFGPPGIASGAFQRLSGLRVGDYGMVFANGRQVAVVIADVGPAYKIGEGSTALLRALSPDGAPHTLAGNVTYVLFPQSRDVAATLRPDTLADTVRQKGTALAQGLGPPAAPN